MLLEDKKFIIHCAALDKQNTKFPLQHELTTLINANMVTEEGIQNFRKMSKIFY